MAFNVEQHANLGYIDRPVKELLDRLCDVHGRTLKKELEFLIMDAAKNNELRPQPISINK